MPVNSNEFVEASEGSNIPEVPGSFLPNMNSKNLFSLRSNSVMNANSSSHQRAVEPNTMNSTKWAAMNLKSPQNKSKIGSPNEERFQALQSMLKERERDCNAFLRES